MIILNATDKKLQALLGGAVTTAQLPIVASFVDVTTSAYTPGCTDTQSNDATPVDIVAAPGASTQRQVKFLSVYNADTVDADVTIRYVNNATNRVLVRITLAAGSTLIYTDGEGWRVMTSGGEIVHSGGAGGSTSPGGADTQVQFNDGGSFGGDAGLTYDKTANALTLAGLLDLSGASAGQVKFPAAQNASADANTFDDYEEGTFSPTIDSSGGGTPTYTTQSGRYRKAAKSVLVEVFLTLATKGTLAAGDARIASLPFTSAAGEPLAIGPVNWAAMTTAVVFMGGTIVGGATHALLVQATAAAAGVSVTQVSDISATQIFRFSVVYQAAN